MSGMRLRPNGPPGRAGAIVPATPILVAVVALGGGPGGSAAQTARIDPPGRLYEVEGSSLHLHCTGAGGPTVLIEGGAGVWSLHYMHIQERVRPLGRVCTYDRAGYGWSEPSPHDRTAVRMAEELHRLLAAAGERGPYVLAGHSLGGWILRVFAARWPGDVAGLVFVESAHPDQFERLPAEVGAVIDAGGAQLRAVAEAVRTGGYDPSAEMVDLPIFVQRPELEAALAASLAHPDTWVTQAREFESARVSAGQARAAAVPPDVPVTVISAGNSFAPFAALGIDVAEANRVWLDLQSELLDTGRSATQLLDEEATHEIQLTAPDLVVEGIARALRRVRVAGGSCAGS